MFITLEGPEGAGKSTALRGIISALAEGERDIVESREPGAGPVGQAIRQILLGGHPIADRAELFLFLADRAQHVETLIRPALQRGAIVVCDRHADSTVVYQGYGRGLDLDLLRSLNLQATGGLKPDLTLLFDLPPEAGLARLTSKDRLDAEPLDFHRRVRDGFLAEAAREPHRWHVLDASQSPEAVLAQALAVVRDRIQR